MSAIQRGSTTLGRLAVVTAVAGLIAAACGGATASPVATASAVARTAAPAVPSVAVASAAPTANPCGIPVKGKCPQEATSLTGAGATFPAVIYTKWVSEYEKLTGVQINYQSIGSGGGIKSITDKTVDYGATDGPMTDKQLADAKAAVLHIPMVMGAVVPTYNLPNVTGNLKFTPEVLSGIFLESIKKWNDPKIVAANPGVTLPDRPITTVHRSDGSGTYIWTDYLCQHGLIEGRLREPVNWPGGVGGKGNEGVAGAVKQTPYSIGYVELIYAIQNKLGIGFV